MSETVAVLDRLTRLGLEPWGEPIALSTETAVSLATMAPYTGIAALLGAAVDLDAVVVDDAAAAVVRQAWTERLVAVVSLDSLLVAVVETLEAAGVPVRVLKGCANASLDEIDPAWRTYGDLDVLVPSGQLLAAVRALAPLGLTPSRNPVRESWTERHGKSVTLVDATGRQVDVHRLLAAGALGNRVDHGSLFVGGTSFEVGGRTVVALDAPHRLMHACYHASLGAVRGPRHRRDILLLAQAVRPSDIAAIVAEGWSATVVRDALVWAGDRGDLPSAWREWAATTPDDPSDRRLLQAQNGSFRRIAVAEIRATRGIAAKLAYAAALVWPSTENLADRGLTRRGHLLSLIRRSGRPG